MSQKAKELKELKRETAAEDDGIEALKKLLKQAIELQGIPAQRVASPLLWGPGAHPAVSPSDSAS